MQYENGQDGMPRVTGLRMSKAGQEQIVEADAYVAALDVPGAKKLIPEVRRLRRRVLHVLGQFRACCDTASVLFTIAYGRMSV